LLKEKLTAAPIFGMPRDEGTYYLDTGASGVGLGAVLSQDQDGQEVVLGYASRILSRTERNYDVTRQELLAVVYGLKAYRQHYSVDSLSFVQIIRLSSLYDELQNQPDSRSVGRHSLNSYPLS